MAFKLIAEAAISAYVPPGRLSIGMLFTAPPYGVAASSGKSIALGLARRIKTAFSRAYSSISAHRNQIGIPGVAVAPFLPHCPYIFYAVLPGISHPRAISAAKGVPKIIAVALPSGFQRDCGFFSNRRGRKGQDNRPSRYFAGYINRQPVVCRNFNGLCNTHGTSIA